KTYKWSGIYLISPPFLSFVLFFSLWPLCPLWQISLRFVMLLLRRRAYARAGLVGNPSDGYHGKTISLIVRNFWAEAVLYEWEDLELVWTDQNQHRFTSIHDLVHDVKM